MAMNRDTASPSPPLEGPPGVPPPSYDTPEVRAILDEPAAGRREVPPERQIFVNRNLRMDKIEAVGFDMDYTLAIYQLRELEELAFGMTVARLVEHHGYPAALRAVRYDPEFVIRGLVMDKEHGNIFKMDRHNHVGRGYHGRRPIPDEALQRLYREEKIHLSSPRFAWIDTLFALPEACLFAEAIELLEGGGAAPVDYVKLYDDIREAIDTVHRDGSLKAVVMADLPRYVVVDPELGPALHKLRSGGKRLFLLTNSLADYTDAVMRHVLDGVLPEYPSWRNYFDAVVTGAQKPAFFSERRPLLALGPDGQPAGEATALERGRTYQGGDLVRLEELLGAGGDRVLYVGDHIYGDILRSRKSSLWRTCLVVEELERELVWLDRNREPLGELSRLEALRVRLEDAIASHRTALNQAERRLGREGADGERPRLEVDRRRLKQELETLRGALRGAQARIDELARALEAGVNRAWGLTFKEGNENSRFGEQVEDYACLYTSRVSNFAFVSPVERFRSPRAAMPHERATVVISTWGDEHAPAAAAARPSKATR
ncbi:MAG TPA: HAD-IG family 5'-nucleotidase [Anaeromyxobacteraceae bacterium]|nr:HAD-IG family 5'-nucleotidase [Anaeromyxobacteraceae bacterium]